MKPRSSESILGRLFKEHRAHLRKAKIPFWDGPEKGGVTQSLLGRFLVCRERFRILTVLGKRERAGFNHRLEYGNLWHACEEGHSKRHHFAPYLRDYHKKLAAKYPDSRDEINKWVAVCSVQFPIYAEYWEEHEDVKRKRPLAQEQVFAVPYTLPSGRTVLLRGKWDALDAIGGKCYIQENKSKGDFNPDRLRQELPNDLQTMLYSIAYAHSGRKPALGGVRYNVVRRPFGAQKHNITQRKGRKTKKGVVGAETTAQFHARLGELIASDPTYYFMRWRVDLLPSDLQRFQRECLDPLLEELCTWWSWIVADPKNPFREGNTIHNRMPFGIYNPLLEGRMGDYYEYLMSGDERRLETMPTMFPELEE